MTDDRDFRSGARVAAWGVALFAATRLAALTLEGTSMAAAVAQAVAAEWGGGRLGITWSDPLAPEPTAGAMGKRAALGAGVGFGAAALVAAVLAATRGALFERASGSASILGVGLVTAGLTAMTQELLFHGVTLRALASVRSPVLRALACGVTSLCAALGEPSPVARVVLVEGLAGIVFGALWIQDRGAWKAWGAHAAWLFATGTLLRGGLFDVKVATTAWGGADAGLTGGWAAVVAMLSVALFALAWARRTTDQVR